jgi:HEAT repeat protein
MHVRIAALEAVGLIDDPAASEILLPHTDGENSELAAAALRALGRVSNHPGAAAALRAALRSPDPVRRLAAAAALAGQPDPKTVEALQWAAVADEADPVALSAIEALGTHARRPDATGEAACAALTTLTAEPRRRESAIATLAALPETRAVHVAAGLRDARPLVRCATVAALGRMKNPDASAAVRAALDDDDAVVRETAITTLDRLGVAGLARRFAAMAREDTSRAVRRAAAAALSRQGHADTDAAHG